MAVTEIAILHSTASALTEELRQRLQQAQSVQEAWHAEHFPHLPSSRIERGDAMFQQSEHPEKILVTVRWDSVPAHWDWIGSDENKQIMAGLSDHIAKDKVVLFHLDAEIFSRPAPQDAIPLLDSPLISLTRLFVDSDKKDAFSKKFNEVRGILEDFAKPHLARGGWRVDKEAETKEEFVLVCGWESLERHFEFAKDPRFNEYKEIPELVTETDIKHFKRFL